MLDMLEFEGEDVAFAEVLDIPEDAVKLLGNKLVVFELSDAVEFFVRLSVPVLFNLVEFKAEVTLFESGELSDWLEFDEDVPFDELLDIPDDAVKLVGSELVVLELSDEVEFFSRPSAPVLLDFVRLEEAVTLLESG